MSLNDVLTVAEAARLAGKSADTIEKACKSGKLKCRKSNGTWLIDRESVKKRYKIKD